MGTSHNANPVFYPAFCFKASPTHFAWVKMAAADVHRLQRPRNFEGQTTFFYNNHPIRFVSLVGVVVARTEVTKRTILTLDDSSGATIDVCILQSDPKQREQTQTDSINASVLSKPEPDAPLSLAASAQTKTTGTITQSMQTEHVSATDRTVLDTTPLQPGAIVRIKGTLSRFRSTMQLNLERFTLIRDTNAEMQFVDERLRFLVEVLAVPWVLLDDEIEQLRAEAEKGDLRAIEERERAEKRVKRRAEREERDYRHIQKRYEREERRRAKEAGDCKEDGVNVMRDIRRKRISDTDGAN